MTANRLVLNTIVEQVEDLVDAFALDVEQVLHGVDIILVPLELQPVLSSQDIEYHLPLLLGLEHVPVQ